MHDCREVANFVLDYADRNDIEITNLSLQKIMYFAHVWFLVSTNKPLIRQNFEAWEFGPVLPYLYRSFKNFGERKISSRITKVDPLTGDRLVAKIDMGGNEKIVLEAIVAFYSRLTASQLVEQSHISGGPWQKVWEHEEKINPGMQITNQSILEYYKSAETPFTLQ